MSALNVVVTHYELSKVFLREDLSQLRSASREIQPSRVSRMVNDFSVSLTNFLDKYERGQDSHRLVLESADDQPTSLLQSYLAEQAQSLGAIEPLESGGFEAKLDSFKFRIEDKIKWVRELDQRLGPFTEDRVRYHESDTLGWLGSFFTMWRGLRRHPWLREAKIKIVPNAFRLGMLGDWATGQYGAQWSPKSIQGDSHGYNVVIHLGDIYYTGTEKEVKDRFLPFFPKPAGAYQRALNANHEMYTGGHGYFNFVLPSFEQSASFFAFVNDNWVLAGLDTAYAGKFNVFSDGKLTNDQVGWLKQLADLHKDKRIILFTHHFPISLIDWHSAKQRFKPQRSRLFMQLYDLLISGRIFAWYWGHEHRCLLYERSPLGDYYGRCVGHGGFPQTRDRTPYIARSPIVKTIAGVDWRKLSGVHHMPDALFLDGPNQYLPGMENDFGSHGYMTLEFDGKHLNEIVQLPDSTIIYDRQLV